MPFRRNATRRKFTPRRRFVRRRPMRTARRFPRRVHRPMRSIPYSYKQTIELSPLGITGGNTTFFARTFQAADIPQSATFASLYDSYRLMAVKMTFYPQYNTYNANVASVCIPELYTVVDYNDATVPTTVAELFAYQNNHRRQLMRPISRYFKPRAQITGISGGVGGDGTMSVSRFAWMDTSNLTVLYYAIKGALTFETTVTTPQTIRVLCTYYIQFKNVR